MHDLRWSEFEYHHRPKTVDWFWGLGLIAILAAGLSLFFSNILLSILILLGAITIGLFAVRAPKKIEYRITDVGIYMGEDYLHFEEITSFFIERQHHEDKLIIAPKRFLGTLIVIPIRTYTMEQVKDALIHKIEESPHHEPLIHRLIDLLGI